MRENSARNARVLAWFLKGGIRMAEVFDLFLVKVGRRGSGTKQRMKRVLVCSNSDKEWRLICVGDHTCYGGAHRQWES